MCISNCDQGRLDTRGVSVSGTVIRRGNHVYVLTEVESGNGCGSPATSRSCGRQNCFQGCASKSSAGRSSTRSDPVSLSNSGSGGTGSTDDASTPGSSCVLVSPASPRLGPSQSLRFRAHTVYISEFGVHRRVKIQGFCYIGRVFGSWVFKFRAEGCRVRSGSNVEIQATIYEIR